ncbi:unnamed protein product [Closterium sp. Yama58-4]|nr:unnamed protein product [Closterium sp. Yama58-4]
MEALKGHNVVIVAGGASVSLAGENKDILLNEDFDFSAPCLDFACLWFARVVASEKLEPDLKKQVRQRALALRRERMSGMIVVYGFQRVLQDYDFASRNRSDVVRAPKTKSLKSLRDRIVKHACDLAVEIVLAEPALHKTAGARSTALHAPAVDSAAGTVADPGKENPPASKTPDGDNAERDSEAGGDSSAGILNRKGDDAETEKEPGALTAEKNIAADDVGKASPPRVTENRLEVASGSSGRWPKKSGNRSAEQLSKLPALTLAHAMVNIFKKCRELVEADSDHTVQSALCATAGLEVTDDDGKVKGKAQKTLFAATVAFGIAAVWSLTAEYTRSNTAGGARSAWKGVATEVRRAAVTSGSAVAKLCGASADELEGLQVCWRDVYSVIRKRQGDQLEAAASIEKKVLKLYGEELDMTDKVVVHQLVQGTRGKGKNGDAGEKDGKSEKYEKKGEEAEHSDGEDEDDDTLMVEGSEGGKDFA